MDILKKIQEDQDQLCKWLSTDPDHIIKQCGDILTMNQCLELQKQDVPLAKMTLLLKMITEGGESKCQSFYDILKEQQTHYPDMQFFKQKGSQSQTVHADGGSAAIARNIKGVKANSLNLSVKVTGSPGVTPQSERTAGQLAACNASNNSFASADTLQDVDISGDINMSVEFNNQLPAGPPEPKKRKHEVEVPLPEKTMASTQGSSVKILVASKVELVEWLRSDLYILQHAHSDGIIDERVYDQLMNIVQPEEACTKLIDKITKKGEGPSSQFLKLLKKQKILDTYPQLKEWNPSFLQPGPHGPMKSSLSVEDKRLFFKKNRRDLVSKVKNVKPIVDDLRAAGLHDEMAANVDADNTLQDRMRRILDSATSSVAVKALFTALLEHENDVMKDLLGKKAPE